MDLILLLNGIGILAGAICCSSSILVRGGNAENGVFEFSDRVKDGEGLVLDVGQLGQDRVADLLQVGLGR